MKVKSSLKAVASSTIFMSLFGAIWLGGCASVPPVKTQAYAPLKSERAFEYEFPTVWKGIEEALHNYRVKNRNPSDVDPVELKRLSRRSLKTDWIYGRSRDKYQEYSINGTPRKIYLQTRLQYEIEAKKTIGGVNVQIKTTEEIERLKSDGSSDGYTEMDVPDSSRAAELLDKIQQSILSAAPETNN